MDGIITSVQRMSVHDGPGIRSTIFMKGCNLRCRWCHNPETFSFAPELEWIKTKCIGCQACLDVCQTGALSLINGNISFHKGGCTACFDCIPECYPEALHKIGRRVTPESLFGEIEQDFPFFEESGGGITISGGEPMLQKLFVISILKLFRTGGIHTALDTNLSVPWKHYEQLLPYTSLVMADLKAMDNELHEKWTGGDNSTIIRNIRNLDESGTPYFIRTPFIPGFNDSEKEFRSIAGLLSTLKNMKRFDLLPYHPLGNWKYVNLGVENPLEGVTAPASRYLQRYASILEEYGINYHIN